jgi:hypothetical protein
MRRPQPALGRSVSRKKRINFRVGAVIGYGKFILNYTGRFIMYFGITKNYRKTVGHVFTKPAQREGTIHFFPQ